MVSCKSVRFHVAANVIYYEVEDCEQDDDTYEACDDSGVVDTDVRSSYESDLSAVSDVMAAVYRARKLRASVEQDLFRSSEGHRRSAAEDKLAELVPSANKSSSLLARFRQRLTWTRSSGACHEKGHSVQTINLRGRCRWGAVELFQRKQVLVRDQGEGDAWTRSLLCVGPSHAQAGSTVDTSQLHANGWCLFGSA
eukprot:TRINITY_DN13008_c0_g1_i1.p1 TRINITY_DN13008_c0_g1~~TRINITY_DN13008_c0_g1_i1.p1  ORF type:complete len:196 (-),score=22.59 TRINITY_DN13008_c0_g1_i1:384-971(-)